MTKHSKGKEEAPRASTAYGKEPGTETCSEARGGLQMAPELMLDLARKAAELVVERIGLHCPADNYAAPARAAA